MACFENSRIASPIPSEISIMKASNIYVKQFQEAILSDLSNERYIRVDRKLSPNLISRT